MRTIEEILRNLVFDYTTEELNTGKPFEKAALAICEYYLSLMPEKRKHSESCIYIIEPRYFNNPYKEKYCNCGSVDFNESIDLMVREIKESK